MKNKMMKTEHNSMKMKTKTVEKFDENELIFRKIFF